MNDQNSQLRKASWEFINNCLVVCLFFLNRVDIIRTSRCPLEMKVEREIGIEIYENIYPLINLRSRNLGAE